MSMVICKNCDRLIDSDDDPECFVEVGNMRRLHQEIVLCGHCRDSMMDGEQSKPETSPAQTVVSIVRQEFPNAPVYTEEDGTVVIDLSRR